MQTVCFLDYIYISKHLLVEFRFSNYSYLQLHYNLFAIHLLQIKHTPNINSSFKVEQAYSLLYFIRLVGRLSLERLQYFYISWNQSEVLRDVGAERPRRAGILPATNRAAEAPDIVIERTSRAGILLVTNRAAVALAIVVELTSRAGILPATSYRQSGNSRLGACSTFPKNYSPCTLFNIIVIMGKEWESLSDLKSRYRVIGKIKVDRNRPKYNSL